MPTLYLIPTPADNPDDITLRALRLLETVPIITSPYPEATAELMMHHGIAARVFQPPSAILEALETTTDAAIVGIGDVPAIADDATAQIVAEAIRRGIRVEPIPGVSLPITALVLSALPPDAFVYIGRLPDDSDLSAFLTPYAYEHATLIMTLHSSRLDAALEAARGQFGDRSVCLVNTPGAPDSIILRGALEQFALPSAPLVGDIALVIGGAAHTPARVWDEDEVRAALQKRLDSGEPLKLAAKAIAAQSGWDRRRVYALGMND